MFDSIHPIFLNPIIVHGLWTISLIRKLGFILSTMYITSKSKLTRLRLSLIETSMTSSNCITLAAVPEQVNIPIKICLEQGIFNKHNIDVNYVVVPEGTGNVYCIFNDVSVDNVS